MVSEPIPGSNGVRLVSDDEGRVLRLLPGAADERTQQAEALKAYVRAKRAAQQAADGSHADAPPNVVDGVVIT